MSVCGQLAPLLSGPGTDSYGRTWSGEAAHRVSTRKLGKECSSRCNKYHFLRNDKSIQFVRYMSFERRKKKTVQFLPSIKLVKVIFLKRKI